MAKIKVRERFTLRQGDQFTKFEVGEHEVSDEIARHPYVLMWSEVIEQPEMKPKAQRKRKTK